MSHVALPYPTPTSDVASRIMRANRKVGTRPEVLLRSMLHRRGLRFRKDVLIHTSGTKVKPDVVFTRQRVAAFMDGCFWHCCPAHGTTPASNADYWGPKLLRNVQRDHLVNVSLQAAGWTVIRIWEHEIRLDLDHAVRKVELAVDIPG